MPFPVNIADIQPFVELNVSSWASVYKAYQPSLDRVVLLKVLNPKYSQEKETSEWFKSEAQLTAKVKHPNVVSVYGFGESDDGLFFTTEFVDGITLREVISRGPVPYPIAVFIFEQMALGLQSAHKQGVMHRDLKPENVLISLEGYVKLCDFGFASQLGVRGSDGEIRGTLGYISPELVLDGQSGEASDLFAMGAVFYEMLLGAPAFYAADTNQYISVIQDHDPMPVLESATFIPESIRQLCGHLLLKDPFQRIQTSTEALENVQAIMQSEGFRVSSTILSAWWSDPGSYTIPETKSTRSADRLPIEPGESVKKAPQSGWIWMSSAAVLLVVLVIAFASGLAKQTGTPPQNEQIVGETNVQVSSTLIEDSMESSKVPQSDIIEDSIGAEVLVHNKLDDVEREDIEPIFAQSGEITHDSTIKEIVADSLHQVDTEGMLTVLCLPSCTVQIAGEEKGRAPPALTIPLLSGKYDVQLNNPDFPSYVEEIELVGGQHDSITVSLLSKVGTLELTVIPWGEVFIDSTSYGVFPPSNPIRIWPGEHTLRVVHKELGEREIKFTIGENERLSRTVNFGKTEDRSQKSEGGN